MSRAPSSQQQWEHLRSAAFRAPWLSAEHEQELIASAQGGDRAALHELCESHLRLVVQIAAQYGRSWVEPEDLVGEGTVGLVEAIHRFDLTQNTRLSTYAAWWIRARIRAHASASRSIVGLPTTRGARVVRARLAGAEHALSQRLGRAPTRAELAVELNVSEADVTYVAATYAARNTSLSDPDVSQHFEPPDAEPGPEDLVAEQESQGRLRARLSRSLAALGTRDRMILDAHFLREESSMADLGATLGISRQRVSQIVSRLRKSLEKELRSVAC